MLLWLYTITHPAYCLHKGTYQKGTRYNIGPYNQLVMSMLEEGSLVSNKKPYHRDTHRMYIRQPGEHLCVQEDCRDTCMAAVLLLQEIHKTKW